MEEVHVLNVDDEIHLYCLHYVFLTHINNALQQIYDGWNNHPVIRRGDVTIVTLD